jgi:CRP/FNR family cyclic AMP-dependent transcriptional regulator
MLHGLRESSTRNSSANSREDARQLLRKCVLFRGLAADQQNVIVTRARIRHFIAGQNIFQIGSPGDSMMAVLTGNIRISVPAADGREVLLAILHPGEVFGEIALLDGKERTADAWAITDCKLGILERADVLDFLRRQPSACFTLIDVLCNRLRRTDEHIAELALLQVPIRLAKVLLRITNGKPTVDQTSPTIQMSQQELGNLIGAARESVNKCLREWHNSGIVCVKDRLITIADPKALKELAQRG